MSAPKTAPRQYLICCVLGEEMGADQLQSVARGNVDEALRQAYMEALISGAMPVLSRCENGPAREKGGMAPAASKLSRGAFGGLTEVANQVLLAKAEAGRRSEARRKRAARAG